MTQNESTSLIAVKNTKIRNTSSNLSKIIHGQAENADYVSFLRPADVKLMIATAKLNKRQQNGDRNACLIQVLFDGCLRISEALGLRHCDIQRTSAGWLLAVLGKGNRPGIVAVSADTVAALKSYILDYHIGDTERIFNLSRSGAFREIQHIYEQSGVRKPSMLQDRVGAIHILRHSGCICRLQISGQPKEIQEQLRHRSAGMTLRYLKTVSHIEALRNQQAVNVWE